MPSVEDSAGFVALAEQLFLPEAFRHALVALNYGSIRLFCSIHSQLCVASPSNEALQDVCLLISSSFPFLSFSADDIRRLRGFAMACSHELSAAMQSAGTLALLPPVSAPVTTNVTDYGMDAEDGKDRKMAHIVARQWAAYCIANQRAEPVPSSEQVPDKDVYIWFIDASSSGALRHMPDFMRVKSRSSPRVEQNVMLAEGMKLLVDTVDNTAAKVMVATCISQARFLLRSLEAAFTIMIDDADDGGPPGTDGYRIITHLNGTQEKQRYFAVTFAETFMARYLKASQEEHYLALPGIFTAALTKIADLMGNWRRHADTACNYVCTELSAPWRGEVPDSVRNTAAQPGKPLKGGGVPRQKGRCFTYDNNGSCPKGDECPWRNSHKPKPAPSPKPRTTDDDRRQYDRRDDDRDFDRRDYDRRSNERDAPRDRDGGKRSRFQLRD